MKLFDVWRRAKQNRFYNNVLAPALAYMSSVLGITGDYLTIPALFAAVKAISEDAARVPLYLYDNSQGLRERITEGVGELVIEPNEHMHDMAFRKALVSNLLLHGNSYGIVVRNNRGAPVALYPIQAENMRIQNRADGLEYIFTGSAGTKTYPARDVIHCKGFTLDGYTGLSLVKYLARSLNLAELAAEYSFNMIKNQARPGAVLQFKQAAAKISEGTPEWEKLKKEFNEAYSGVARTGKTMVIPASLEYKEMSMPKEDLQMINTRKFQMREVAAVLRIPLHMLQDLERATYNNISELSTEYVQYSITPIVQEVEKELARKLLTKAQRLNGIYFEHTMEGLLRGSQADRLNYYSALIDRGVITINEVRKKENLEPLPDDQLPAPQTQTINFNNMRTRELGGQVVETRSRAAVARDMQSVLAEVHEFITSALGELPQSPDELQGLIDRNKQTLIEGVQELMRDKLTKSLTEAAKIAGAGVGGAEIDMIKVDQFVESYIDKAAIRAVNNYSKKLIAAAEKGEDLTGVRMSDSVIADEGVRADSAISKKAWALAGIAYVRWVTSGSDTCPYCKQLSGVVIPIRESFVVGGMSADGKPLPTGKIGHPPAHKGCDCKIVGV